MVGSTSVRILRGTGVRVLVLRCTAGHVMSPKSQGVWVCACTFLLLYFTFPQEPRRAGWRYLVPLPYLTFSLQRPPVCGLGIRRFGHDGMYGWDGMLRLSRYCLFSYLSYVCM
ncbi:hypothetical protein P153DRAFT_142113 [Dothidotthia symphoricarpi CBS 119687]|uniref:Uncharacterized protein n=1 Tax=Dothidotthia symphoricarpi CBS 119687 TaxID=1392245 RepID=A0A6A5ZWL8_9PLEO|nr:uncharacterized protein P153DRAFT_142113 [Dothidotthia symphoricarpi CBS 119687]KAF2123980.1 hypothetical protein P153DRAFT_142113 [Dothidotthia symphoricarpi CBS 119687]